MQNKYCVGMHVKLISMLNDPDSIESGSIGIIEYIDDMNTLFVRWENGRILGIVPEIDDFIIL